MLRATELNLSEESDITSMIIFYLVSCYNSWLHVEQGQIKEEGDYKRFIKHCSSEKCQVVHKNGGMFHCLPAHYLFYS